MVMSASIRHIDRKQQQSATPRCRLGRSQLLMPWRADTQTEVFSLGSIQAIIHTETSSMQTETHHARMPTSVFIYLDSAQISGCLLCMRVE